MKFLLIHIKQIQTLIPQQSRLYLLRGAHLSQTIMIKGISERILRTEIHSNEYTYEEIRSEDYNYSTKCPTYDFPTGMRTIVTAASHGYAILQRKIEA